MATNRILVVDDDSETREFLAEVFQDQDWEVALEVQNLFDKYYFMSVSDITRSLGLVTGVPGLPRTRAVAEFPV